MSAHHTTVEWKRDGQVFIDKKYSRAHVWTFDGGAVVPGSSSTHHRLTCSAPREGAA